MKPTDTPQLDTRVRFVAPENIAFEHRLAGPFTRLPAYLIDMAIRVAVMGLLAWIVALMGFSGLGMGVGAMLFLLAWFVMEWFYGGLFETYWNGQTPGKRALGLRVVSTDGRPISAMQAILRNVLRAVDQQPMYTFQLGLLATACNPRYQRLGDLAAGTIVIAEQRERMGEVMRIQKSTVRKAADVLPAGFVVPRSLSRVLVKYVERREFFGPARRAEIASRLGDVLTEQLNLPPGVDYDALLCALYQRTFIADDHSRPAEASPAVAPQLVGGGGVAP